MKWNQPNWLYTLYTLYLFNLHIEPAPPHLLSLYSSSSTICRPIFTIINHQPLLDRSCITSHVDWNQLPSSIFIPSTSFCSLSSSWFISSCTDQIITILVFTLTICHSLRLSSNQSVPQILSSIVFLVHLDFEPGPVLTAGHWRLIFFKFLVNCARLSWPRISFSVHVKL